MIIDNAAIRLQSRHEQFTQSVQRESLDIRFERPARQDRKPEAREDAVRLSSEAKALPQQAAQASTDEELDATHSLTLQILKQLIKHLTGHDFKLFSPKDLQSSADQISYQAPPAAPEQAASAAGDGFGLTYQKFSSYREVEQTQFSAQGVINTKDGKRIEFSLSLNMSREFYQEHSETLRLGDAAKIDPLVVNFDGNAAELSDSRFEFDLDADGSLDQIALLKSGSALLALDKNADGKINDGSELFGTRSGDGFADLAAYDVDNNQFIDEADPIYSKLRLWQRHADGSQQLLALGDKNIGAIYLGHTATPFQLKTADNQSLGEVVSSGVYLNEQGGTGSVQQINLTA
ncbi:hypothetical protein [Methylomonas rhizoryzae]|uniref:hypothetical protein n=1 Tax=Methylomonas rhizoryzae TaxID=2608981 RepID=UPI001232A782|nr:hypothetical protein [Methylomonas rhizoryzae]